MYFEGFGKFALRRRICFLHAHALEEELRGKRRKTTKGSITTQKYQGISKQVLMIKFSTPETEGWL